METKRPRVVPHRGVEGGEARLPSLLDSRRRPRVTNRPFNHECLRSFLALMGRRPSCLAANAVAGRPISWASATGFVQASSSSPLVVSHSGNTPFVTLRSHPGVVFSANCIGRVLDELVRVARSSRGEKRKRKLEEEEEEEHVHNLELCRCCVSGRLENGLIGERGG